MGQVMNSLKKNHKRARPQPLTVSRGTSTPAMAEVDVKPEEIVLIVMGFSFKVNRKLVKDHSPYLAELITRADGVSSLEVPLETISPVAFKTILEWMEPKKLNINLGNALEIYFTAKQLDIKDVMLQSRSYMEPFFKFVNPKLVDELETLTSYDELCARFVQLLSPDFSQLPCYEYVDLTADDMYLLFSKDKVPFLSEKEMFDTLACWLNHDWEKRRHHSTRLLKCIRFPLLSYKELHHILCEDSQNVFFWDSVETLQWVLACVLHKHFKDESQSSSGPCPQFDPRPRQYGSVVAPTTDREHITDEITDDAHFRSSVPPLLHSDEPQEVHRLISQDDDDTNIFPSSVELDECELPSILLTHERQSPIGPITRSHSSPDLVHHDVFLEPLLFCLGGAELSHDGHENKTGTQMHSLDIRRNTWLKQNDMPFSRAHGAVCATMDHIYYTGGSDPMASVDATNHIFCYDFKIGKWSKMTSMSVARRQHSAVIVGNFIYIIGGVDENHKVLRSVERYDIISNRWKEMEPLLCGRAGSAAIYHNGEVLVIGGATAGKGFPLTNTVEAFNAIQNRWSTREPLKKPRAFLCALAVRDTIWLVGGLIGDTILSTRASVSIDEYRDGERTLDPDCHMEIRRCAAHAIFMEPHLVILGGQHSSINGTVLTAECINMDSQKWSEPWPPLPTNATGICYATVWRHGPPHVY